MQIAFCRRLRFGSFRSKVHYNHRGFMLKLFNVVLALAACILTPSKAAAEMVVYDFTFAINYSPDQRFPLDGYGSGRFGFYEQGTSEGASNCPVCGMFYSRKPYFLEVTFAGQTYDVLANAPGIKDPVMQDIPAGETYARDQFSLGGYEGFILFYSNTSTLSNQALTASNVDALWQASPHDNRYQGWNRLLFGYHVDASVLTLSRASAVPEPSVWMTLILGFLFVGLARRRQGNSSRLAPEPKMGR